MPSGGARAGAGRKPTALKYASKINKAEKQIADRLPEIVDAMLELALGVTAEETGKKGETIIFKRAPDRGAGEYLINRILGKPVERQELGGIPNGEPIPIMAVDYRQAIAPLKPEDDEP